jgi:uncharacterized protein
MTIQEFNAFIENKCGGAKPLFIVIRGSQAYGTSTPESDIDYAGVYIQKKEDILGFEYKEQINDDKNDTVFYEIKRFLDLLFTNNPTVLELLNTSEDCIIYKHPLFDKILENKNIFITKKCKNSFGGYSRQQISKAKGQDKKQNWEKERIERKQPIDFCYIHINEKSISLIKYLNDNNLSQDFCGLSKIPHSKELYALFYDNTKTKNFRGINFENSNDIRLTSIPKNSDFIGLISYSKDSYSIHCKDYNEYQTWLKNKNEQRWIDVKNHNQKIDGKNMMHCQRLLNMSKEIALGKGIIVKRPDAEYLLKIRKGEIDLQTLINNVENEIKEIDNLFNNSNLPDNIDYNFVNDLLVRIRKEFY